MQKRGRSGFRVETVEELINHDGDLVEVDAYDGVVNFLLRRRVIGRLDIPPYWKDRNDYLDRKGYLIWTVYSPVVHGEYRFRTLKESLEDITERETNGPIEKKLRMEAWKRELVPLNKVSILECKCKKATQDEQKRTP